jgi:hypothetical protein
MRLLAPQGGRGKGMSVLTEAISKSRRPRQGEPRHGRGRPARNPRGAKPAGARTLLCAPPTPKTLSQNWVNKTHGE